MRITRKPTLHKNVRTRVFSDRQFPCKGRIVNSVLKRENRVRENSYPGVLHIIPCNSDYVQYNIRNLLSDYDL